MSDRVQALIDGIAIRLHTTERTLIKVINEASPINCSWDELPDAWQTSYRQNAVNYVSFLASQRLGWAEKLELPRNPHTMPSDMEIPEDGFYSRHELYNSAQQHMVYKGAVKFAPLEIGG